MQFNMILALGEDNAFGTETGLPWNIPEELKFFSTITKIGKEKNVVIMGRKTFEKIGLLKNRINIVISSSLLQNEKDCIVCTSLDQAILIAGDHYRSSRVFCIGGKMLYEEALKNPNLKYIFLSRVKGIYKATIYFDLFIPENFKLVDFNFFDERSFNVKIYEKLYEK